jgi:hypothetical protein
MGQDLLIIQVSRSYSDISQSVRFLWPSDQPNASTSTWQTSMSPMRIEPAIPASEEPQTHVLDCAATGIGNYSFTTKLFWDISSYDITQRRVVIPYRRFGTTFGPNFNTQKVKKKFSWISWPSLTFLTLDDGTDNLSRRSVRNCDPHSLTPWSRVLLVKLTGSRLVKKFLAFYETQRFIIAFTSARHLSLSWATLIQFITPYPTS